MSRRLIGVFAKYWAPGQVKTRLAATIGSQRAAEVAQACLHCLVSRLEGMDSHKQIGFTPTAYRAAFQRLAPTWLLRPQCDGDLGTRMTDYFEAAFLAGYHHVVLLGADCPSVPLDQIDKAFSMLQSHDVVLGPADDGGYYLIAGRPPLQLMLPLLSHGQWGDGEVLQRTLALAKQHAVSVGLLASWHDVDELPDLKRLQAELRETNACPHLFELRDRLNNILQPQTE